MNSLTTGFLVSILLLPTLFAAASPVFHSSEEIEAAYKQNLLDEQVFNQLMELAERKLNINAATYDALLHLPDITTYQAYRIVEYRGVYGAFRQVEELLKIEGISNSDVEKWGFFIIAGELPIENFHQYLKVKNQYTGTTSDYGLLHYRWNYPGKQMSGACVAEAFKQYESYEVNNYSVYDGRWRNKLRLNKFYVSKFGNGLVQQVTVGDYRAGFGRGLTLNNSGRTNPQGLYAGDIPSSLDSLQTQKTFRGAGLTLDHLFGQGTVFYSKAVNPAYGFFIEQLLGKRHVEKYYCEELYGLNMNGTFPLEIEAGSTFYQSKREVKGADVWRFPPGDHVFNCGGFYLSSYVGQMNIRGEWSRVLHYGQAFLLESSVNFGWLDLNIHHRHYDEDYYNPQASSYSRHYPYYLFRCCDEVGQMARLRWYKGEMLRTTLWYDQFAHRGRVIWERNSQSYTTIYGNTVIDRELFGETEISCADDVRLTTSLKFNDYNIYQDASGDKITATVGCTFVPQENVQMTLKGSVRSYLHSSGEDFPGDYLLARIRYKLSPQAQLRGEVKYRKFSFGGSESGLREYFLEAKHAINSGLEVRLRYTNVFVPGELAYSDTDELDLLRYSDIYLRNTVLLELAMEW